jgi:hypothetical protein
VEEEKMDLSKFWKYQVRYRLARRLIYAGLFVLPNGRYKDEVLAGLWRLYDEVMARE